jgi:hypothetical protein
MTETVFVAHADAQKRRLTKLRNVLIGAVRGIESNMQENGIRYRCAFGTSTYARDDEWKPNHIRELMRHYRQWCKRRGFTFQCVWVAELTKKGRVHYHWIMFVPPGITPPMPDKQGWWKHGSTNVKWARKPVGYLLKYASKAKFIDGHQFPKGCRLFAAAGNTGKLGWFRCPGWMKKFGRPYDDIRAKNGFWNNHTSGIGYRSPWMFSTSTAEGITLKWVGWTDYDYTFCNWIEPDPPVF